MTEIDITTQIQDMKREIELLQSDMKDVLLIMDRVKNSTQMNDSISTTIIYTPIKQEKDEGNDSEDEFYQKCPFYLSFKSCCCF